jgi:hypothetical protein
VRAVDVIDELRAEAAEYAAVADPASRMSVRARVLALIERLALAPAGLRICALDEASLRANAALRGAIVLHHDLVSRAPLTAFEVVYTATRGVVLIAEHPAAPGFPIGVALALPATRHPSHRRELFDDGGPLFERADLIVMHGLATNPARLGAGIALVRATRGEGRRSSRSPRLTAFTPLTGLRARVIRAVDDPTALGARPDAAELRDQLADLLAVPLLPAHVPEPARGWLAAEARRFADDPAYRTGGFHRHNGATLVGVADLADEVDSDAMWARAHFDYPS